LYTARSRSRISFLNASIATLWSRSAGRPVELALLTHSGPQKIAEYSVFRQPCLAQAFEIHFGNIEPPAQPLDGQLGVQFASLRNGDFSLRLPVQKGVCHGQMHVGGPIREPTIERGLFIPRSRPHLFWIPKPQRLQCYFRQLMTFRHRTKRETDASTRGKSVDFVRRMFHCL